MLDRITDGLERYMDLLSTRQKIVASNIANADTPGFKTRDLDFRPLRRFAAVGRSCGVAREERRQ
jgi:flagellar basal-body rod protein FlgB